MAEHSILEDYSGRGDMLRKLWRKITGGAEERVVTGHIGDWNWIEELGSIQGELEEFGDTDALNIVRLVYEFLSTFDGELMDNEASISYEATHEVVLRTATLRLYFQESGYIGIVTIGRTVEFDLIQHVILMRSNAERKV